MKKESNREQNIHQIAQLPNYCAIINGVFAHIYKDTICCNLFPINDNYVEFAEYYMGNGEGFVDQNMKNTLKKMFPGLVYYSDHHCTYLV